MSVDKDSHEDRTEEGEAEEAAQSRLLESSAAKQSLGLSRRFALASGGLVLLLFVGAVVLRLGPGVAPAPPVEEWVGEVQQLHGNSPEHAESRCEHAAGAFAKIRHLAGLEIRNRHASSAVKAAGHEILKGVHGEKALRHVQTVLDGASLNTAAQLGEVFTEHDMSLIIACELGHEVDGELDTDLPPGDFAGERWDHGLMPFCYHPTCKAKCQEHIEKGIKAITSKVPCVNIHKISYDASKDRCSVYPSVMIKQKDGGCSSQIGVSAYYKHHKQSQLLMAPSWCQYSAKLAHELLHALGCKHEQSRPDRSKSVTIHWDNIKSGMEHNFQISSKASTKEDYDYRSIMHYGAYAFSTNGKVTIEPDDPSAVSDMGQREGLTDNDAEQLCRMYGCLGTCGHIPDVSGDLHRAESHPEAPTTKKRCRCRPTWTYRGKTCNADTASCCNPDNDSKGTWCFTTEKCNGANYDYCQVVQAPTSKKGCTCKPGSNGGHSATASTGYCFNPDNDVGGPWCFIKDQHKCGLEKNWDYCEPKTR